MVVEPRSATLTFSLIAQKEYSMTLALCFAFGSAIYFTAAALKG